MSGIDEGIELLDWNGRLSRFEDEEEKDYSGFMIIAFLLGTLFGMLLIEYIIPVLLDLTL